MSYVVVIHDPARGWDYLTIGPFEQGDQARTEARRWRQPDVRAMVRFLWDGDALRLVSALAVDPAEEDA